MYFAGGSQNQPKGLALPTLFAGTPATITEHIAAAAEINPTAALINRALRPEIRRVAHTCVNSPELVVSHRQSAVRYIEELAAKLEPARLNWRDSLPPNAPGRHLHFPLIHFLAKSLNFPDTQLVTDLANGMPIIGKIEGTPTPNFTPRIREATLTFEQWKAELPERNAMIIDRVRQSQNPPSRRVVLGKDHRRGREGLAIEPQAVGRGNRKYRPAYAAFSNP